VDETIVTTKGPTCTSSWSIVSAAHCQKRLLEVEMLQN